MQPDDFAALIVLMLLAAVLLWALPSCGHPACVAAHQGHTVASRAVEIERIHATWHGADRPDPRCALCAARKRDSE